LPVWPSLRILVLMTKIVDYSTLVLFKTEKHSGNVSNLVQEITLMSTVNLMLFVPVKILSLESVLDVLLKMILNVMIFTLFVTQKPMNVFPVL